MKPLILISFLFQAILSLGQKISVFDNFEFDSSYSLAALNSSFSNINADSKEYCFYVDNLTELNSIKKDWTVKNVIPRISLEEYSISIFLLQNKSIVSSDLLIYPKQGIIHYKNTWYDFDMKKFKKIQIENPLSYHSQTFSFINYLDYSILRDSIRSVPNMLFLFEPTPKKFEGYFYLVSSRTSDSDSPIFVLHDINEELKSQFPTEKVEVENIINDKFNIDNKQKIKTRVKCSKTLYDKYQSKVREKENWVPATFDAKVIFKD